MLRRLGGPRTKFALRGRSVLRLVCKSGAAKILDMPKETIGKKCPFQESVASTHRYEGHSHQEGKRDDITKFVAKKRKKICEAHKKKRSFYKLKRSKIKNGSFTDVEIAPSEYVFYSVINTNYKMDQGTAAAAIARSFMALHKKLDTNNVTGYYLDKWSRSGEHIIILEGFDHKHLKFLYDDAKYMAIDTHILHRRWSCGRDILVLTVFGQQYDLEDVFEGLLPLR